MRPTCYRIVFSILLFLTSSGASFAALIDFEGLGLNSGDTVPSIGIASFTGSAALEGDDYAFISIEGNGKGVSPPFNSTGNTFITSPGGLESSLTKTIEIFFSVPVYDFSFYAADIDSANPTIEKLTATVYDTSGNQLKQLYYNETQFDYGDGNVIFFNFEGASGIRRVTISLSNLATPNLSGIGFGVDNFEFQIVSQPVPEPISMLLFGTGIVGVGGYVRKKFKQN